MRRFLLCSVLLLSSMSTTAMAAAAADVPLVPNSELIRYWTPSSKPFSPTFRPTTNLKKMAEVVELAYTIDKRGRARDVQVLSFSPADTKPQWAVDAIKALRYTPAEGNPDAMPIRTETTVSFQGPPRR